MYDDAGAGATAADAAITMDKGKTVNLSGARPLLLTGATASITVAENATLNITNLAIEMYGADNGAPLIVVKDTGKLHLGAGASITGFGKAGALTPAVVVERGGAVTVDDGFSATGNAGVFQVEAGGSLTVNGGTFSGNTPTTAGVFYVDGGTLTITGGAFTQNNATGNGGVAYANAGGVIRVQGGDFFGNTASSGGVLYASGGTLDISGGAFSGNSATNGGGGALYARSSTVNISGGAFSGNTAGFGGALFAMGNTVHLYGGAFSGNTSTMNQGSEILVDTASAGGALHLHGGRVESTAAGRPGGIYVYGAPTTVLAYPELAAGGHRFSFQYVGTDPVAVLLPGDTIAQSSTGAALPPKAAAALYATGSPDLDGFPSLSAANPAGVQLYSSAVFDLVGPGAAQTTGQVYFGNSHSTPMAAQPGTLFPILPDAGANPSELYYLLHLPQGYSAAIDNVSLEDHTTIEQLPAPAANTALFRVARASGLVLNSGVGVVFTIDAVSAAPVASGIASGSPQTGDTAQPGAWVALMVAAAAGLVWLLVRRKAALPRA